MFALGDAAFKSFGIFLEYVRCESPYIRLPRNLTMINYARGGFTTLCVNTDNIAVQERRCINVQNRESCPGTSISHCRGAYEYSKSEGDNVLVGGCDFRSGG